MTDYPLYMKNSNYYVIINKGDYNNIGVEFKTFNQKFINNDDLRNYLLMDFNEENLKDVLKEIFKGSNNFANICKTFYVMEIKFSDDATPEYKKMIYEKHGVEPKQEKYISVKQINKVKQYAKIKDLKTGVKSIKDYDMINEDSSLYIMFIMMMKLKEYKNKSKSMKEPMMFQHQNQSMILIMHLHRLLLNTFVKNKVFHIMLLILIKLVF